MEDKKEDVVAIEMTLEEFFLMVNELRHFLNDKKRGHFVSRMIHMENGLADKYGWDLIRKKYSRLCDNTQEEHTRKYIAYSVRHPESTPLKENHQEILDIVAEKVKEIQIEIIDRDNGFYN